MKIAIVDDNKQSREELSAAVVAGFKSSGIAITRLSVYDSGNSFLHAFSQERFDLIILDIFMGELSGIDVAKRIREIDSDVRIVFCTTSNDFASEAFGVKACHYILKPVTEAAVKAMIERMSLSDIIRNRYLLLPDGQRVLLRSILYIECIDHLLYFYLSSGSVLRSRLQQKRLEEMLASFSEFYPCAKGVIVNFNHVANRAGNNFTMKNGTTLPISRRRIKQTVGAFENHLFEALRREEA